MNHFRSWEHWCIWNDEWAKRRRYACAFHGRTTRAAPPTSPMHRIDKVSIEDKSYWTASTPSSLIPAQDEDDVEDGEKVASTCVSTVTWRGGRRQHALYSYRSQWSDALQSVSWIDEALRLPFFLMITTFCIWISIKISRWKHLSQWRDWARRACANASLYRRNIDTDSALWRSFLFALRRGCLSKRLHRNQIISRFLSCIFTPTWIPRKTPDTPQYLKE